MTDNAYWLFLEQLRRSGKVNMFGAGAVLARKFGLNFVLAQSILQEWMQNYNSKDYEGLTMDDFDMEPVY